MSVNDSSKNTEGKTAEPNSIRPLESLIPAIDFDPPMVIQAQ